MRPEPNITATAGAEDIAALANNGIFVRMLQSALGQSEKNLGSIPGLIEDIIRDGSWLCWCTGDGQVYRWTPAEFRRFIEAPRPHGCQTPAEKVRQILKATESAGVLARFDELTRGEPGNPIGTNQYTRGKCDNVIVSSPETIPFPSANVPPPTGNSTSYALRRLRNRAPEFLERVHAGELTPNAAMVKAGLRRPQLQAPDDPEKLAAYLLRKWDRERIAALLARLAEALT